MKLSIAIDGPAGAGKSTIAQMLAKKYDLMYINTGSMYRAVALFAERKGITYTQKDLLCSMIGNLQMVFKGDKLFVNGEDITEEIRLPNISSIVSYYAAIAEVRAMLVELQQDMSRKFGVVMDGRDIGTVVLKNADFKFFLTASPEQRAKRRFIELKEKGVPVDYDSILSDMNKRDYIDSHRKVTPLLQADDALIIDTSDLDIPQVVDRITQIISGKNNI